jgi:hypothetical protein
MLWKEQSWCLSRLLHGETGKKKTKNLRIAGALSRFELTTSWLQIYTIQLGFISKLIYDYITPNIPNKQRKQRHLLFRSAFSARKTGKWRAPQLCGQFLGSVTTSDHSPSVSSHRYFSVIYIWRETEKERGICSLRSVSAYYSIIIISESKNSAWILHSRKDWIFAVSPAYSLTRKKV